MSVGWTRPAAFGSRFATPATSTSPPAGAPPPPTGASRPLSPPPEGAGAGPVHGGAGVDAPAVVSTTGIPDWPLWTPVTIASGAPGSVVIALPSVSNRILRFITSGTPPPPIARISAVVSWNGIGKLYGGL